MKSAGTIAFVSVLALSAAATAYAAEPQTSSYFEVGYAAPQIGFAGYSATPGNIVARGGFNFTKNFSAEVFGSAGVASGNINNVTLKLDSAYGAYLKAQAELAPHFEFYARAGWVHATLSSNAVSGTGSDSSFSYGVGAQYLFTKNWYLQGDYSSYYDKQGVTIKGPAIAVGYRF